MGGGVRCLFTFLGVDAIDSASPFSMGESMGKRPLLYPPSGSPDSYDPKTFWRIVANGGERGGVMVANYVAAFVPHSVGVLHPFLHGHRRHQVGEEANGNILWAKFTRR